VSSFYFDDRDDPLLMAIMQELLNRSRAAGAPPRPDVGEQRMFAEDWRSLGRSPQQPALPTFQPPERPEEPEPPAWPDPFAPGPELTPPAQVPTDTARPPGMPPPPPPIPQPETGGVTRVTPVLPTPPAKLTPGGGALALALMRAARPAALGFARSRSASSRNSGLRSKAVR
jgi:hypothetical protein